MAGGILVPQPRIEPEPLPCKHRVLTTGPPEKSPHCIIKAKRNPKGANGKNKETLKSAYWLLVPVFSPSVKVIHCYN